MRDQRQKHSRRKSYKAGKYAEWVSLGYLMVNGYRPIAQRYKCPVGEIDLIVTRGGMVIFVEVKYRSNRDIAAFSITPKQQSRIAHAAQYWAMKNRQDPQKTMRFDVVLTAPWRWPRHIKNAFVDKAAN